VGPRAAESSPGARQLVAIVLGRRAGVCGPTLIAAKPTQSRRPGRQPVACARAVVRLPGLDRHGRPTWVQYRISDGWLSEDRGCQLPVADTGKEFGRQLVSAFTNTRASVRASRSIGQYLNPITPPVAVEDDHTQTSAMPERAYARGLRTVSY
jgi:hypothetical protein